MQEAEQSLGHVMYIRRRCTVTTRGTLIHLGIFYGV